MAANPLHPGYMQPLMHDMIGAAKVPISVEDEHRSPAAVEYEKGGKTQRRLISDIGKNTGYEATRMEKLMRASSMSKSEEHIVGLYDGGGDAFEFLVEGTERVFKSIGGGTFRQGFMMTGTFPWTMHKTDSIILWMIVERLSIHDIFSEILAYKDDEDGASVLSYFWLKHRSARMPNLRLTWQQLLTLMATGKMDANKFTCPRKRLAELKKCCTQLFQPENAEAIKTLVLIDSVHAGHYRSTIDAITNNPTSTSATALASILQHFDEKQSTWAANKEAQAVAGKVTKPKGGVGKDTKTPTQTPSESAMAKVMKTQVAAVKQLTAAVKRNGGKGGGSGGGGRGGKKQKPGTCGNCGSSDHRYKNCPKIECHNCNKLGHIAPYCRAKGGGRYKDSEMTSDGESG